MKDLACTGRCGAVLSPRGLPDGFDGTLVAVDEDHAEHFVECERGDNMLAVPVRPLRRSRMTFRLDGKWAATGKGEGK